MDTSAIRQNLIEKIKTSLPDNVVMDIARMIKLAEDTEIVLSEEQTFAIEEAIKSYEQGNFVSDEVAESKIQQWLKE